MGDFGPIGELPSVEEIKQRINDQYDSLFHYDNNGNRSALVCTFCDEILMYHQDVNYLSFDALAKNKSAVSWESVIQGSDRIPCLEAKYTFQGSLSKLQDVTLLDGLAVSPRGTIGRKKNDRRSPWGFSCCSTCKTCILKGHTPLYAIVNQNRVGHPPTVLTDLTPVELALITPVKGYGYCFSYAGGVQMNLKGTMTFMKVEEKQIGRAVSHLVGMGLESTVVILLTGNMTPEQKNAAKKAVRVDKLLAAVSWLCQYNRDWQDVDMAGFQAEIANLVPTVVDRSTSVESENSNVESQEIFSCYFPDGGMDKYRGGFETHEEFKTFVNEMQKNNYNLNLKMDLARKFVQGKEGDQLTRACLLQFPYGVGGMNEKRVVSSDDSFTNSVDQEDFLKHLSKLSQPVFQLPMFQLISYSMSCKLKLLRHSRLQVRGEHSAKALANGLDHQGLVSAIRARAQGQRGAGTQAAKTLLNAVDACSKAIPHSKEAATQARSTAEAMQHHFGTGSVWVTVTPDDENSLLMQVLSGEIIDDNSEPKTLSTLELGSRRDARRQLRLDYPGFTAIHFEMLTAIVVEIAIGWNLRTNRSTGIPGLFGICVALALAKEDQARLTIHTHFTAWMKGVRELQNDVFFGDWNVRSKAVDTLLKYQDHIASTSLFESNKHQMKKIFDHPCTIEKYQDRQIPTVVTDQDLRNLRNKHGYAAANGRISYCPHCDYQWTYEQMVETYTRVVGDIPADPCETNANTIRRDDETRYNIPKPRMLAEIIQYQKECGASGDDLTCTFINACYNHHVSCHTKGCFKCNKKASGEKHVCTSKCECRMRYPDRSRAQSAIKYHANGVPWMRWNGEEILQPLVEILPKRNTFDVFQNTSCRAISESKLACNTNAKIITDGPIGCYQFKYNFKNTQKDDSAEYAHVDRSIKTMKDRRHEDDRKEAVRRVCRASFAHNSSNIIGPPLASHLTRHGSRFHFSHEPKYCPLKDLLKLLRNQNVPAVARFDDSGDFYFENMALHYLCRPTCLEMLSPKEFFETYEIVHAPKKRKRGEPDLRLINTHQFTHPTSKLNKNGTVSKPTQAARLYGEKIYIKISQWMFKDTGRFKSNLLTCPDNLLCVAMETYAEVVLALLISYRGPGDFIPANGAPSFPFVHKLREIYFFDEFLASTGQPKRVFTDDNVTFLQNIQNAAYNAMRYKIGDDDLQSDTMPFQSEEGDVLLESYNDGEEEEDVDLDDGLDYESLLQELEDCSPTDGDITYLTATMQDFCLDGIRNRGSAQCGFNDDLPCPPLQHRVTGDFVVDSLNQPLLPATALPVIGPVPIKYKVKDLVTLLISKTAPRARPSVFERNPTVQVLDANGSLASIFSWADAAKLDRLQRRAFEIIVCAFILTFFNTSIDDGSDEDVDQKIRREHREYRKILLELIDTPDGQLILLLLGPGGSGKTTVINLVVAYAREYCDFLKHPFTSRTIVITAMSGVAATWIHGETAHKAIGMNRGSIPGDMIQDWSDTRLVFVDEISFGGNEDLEKIQRNLGVLKKKTFCPFGGLSIVFCGDFSQLEPVGRTPLYGAAPTPAFHYAINAFIELDGHHRFKDDIPWGHCMARFRAGEPTVEDIRLINERCLVSPTNLPPNGVQVATYHNKDRDASNAAIFEKFCETYAPADRTATLNDAIIIFMDNVEMRDSKKVFSRVNSNSVLTWIYSNLGEDGCKFPKNKTGRIDPALKLYYNCPLMLTQNKAVNCGQANGSRIFLEKVQAKVGEHPFLLRMDNGTIIRAFFASQVKYVTCRHEAPDILPTTFNVESEKFKFRAKINIDGDQNFYHMEAQQFPVISNSATTGHKLQGYTAMFLLVLNWVYGGNWAYTVLSRVRTMAGLFIIHALSYDLSKYAMPKRMKEMLANFRETVAVKVPTQDWYDKVLTKAAKIGVPVPPSKKRTSTTTSTS